MNRIAPYLTQDLDPSPAWTLKRFARIRDRFKDVGGRYKAAVDSLPESDERLKQLENDLMPLFNHYTELLGRAMKILISAGASPTRWIKVGDLLFVLVHDDHSDQSQIAVLNVEKVLILG